MKNKKIVIIIVAIILVACMICAYWIYQNNNDHMSYKFENGKLYITQNSKEWIEVPFDVSYTIKHLNEEHKGRYEDGTYQLDSKKIVFYVEVPNEELTKIYDTQEGAREINEPSYSGKYLTYIIYSDDKGKTWENTLIGSSDYRDCFTSIKFDNKNNGEMTLKTRENIGIYHYITKNGGKEWLVQYDAEYELTNMKLHYIDSLREIPKNLTPTEATERGYFVYDCVEDKTYNEDVLNEFVKNTEMNAQNRIADEIIMVIYSMDGNPTIYNLGYKYNENIGYILAKDYTRTNYSKMNALEDIDDMVVDIDIPSEYYGITIKDSGFSSQIISLTSYSEDYEDIEIARYVRNNIDITTEPNSNTQNTTFTRTYNVLNVTDSNDENYLYLTIRQFQEEEVKTVKVQKSIANSIKANSDYEFTFKYTDKAVEDNIESIFTNTEIILIKETDKQGLEQIQDSIR